MIREFRDFILYSVAFDHDIPKTFEEACSSLDKAKWELQLRKSLLHKRKMVRGP
jgi:hypothetical protein